MRQIERRLSELEKRHPAGADGFRLQELPGLPGLWLVEYANGQPGKAWSADLADSWLGSDDENH